jgi:hypothetical protein
VNGQPAPAETPAIAEVGAIPDGCPHCAETVAETPQSPAAAPASAPAPAAVIVQDIEDLDGTRVYAGVGRMLHAYSPDWQGPRPAVVVNVCAPREHYEQGFRMRVNVNVQHDYINDKGAAPHPASTRGGVYVFDQLSQQQRDVFLAQGHTWCEWPPRD